MSRIIAIHSFRGGTGKSNTTANVATLLAAGGGASVWWTPISSRRAFTSCSGWTRQRCATRSTTICGGRCQIEQAAHDVTPSADLEGASFSSHPASNLDIARVMHDGYDVGLLNEGFRELIKGLALDALLIDTHPGLNEETLLSIAMSNALAIIMRPDQQDYEARASPFPWRANSGCLAWCWWSTRRPKSSTSARSRTMSNRPTAAK